MNSASRIIATPANFAAIFGVLVWVLMNNATEQAPAPDPPEPEPAEVETVALEEFYAIGEGLP